MSLFRLLPCLTPLSFSLSVYLPYGKKTGLSRKTELLAGTPLSLVFGGSSPECSQNSVEPVPRLSLSFPPLPGLGSSNLPWNMPKLCSHHTAICNLGPHWSGGRGEQATVCPKTPPRRTPRFTPGIQGEGAVDTISAKGQALALTLVTPSGTSDLSRR